MSGRSLLIVTRRKADRPQPHDHAFKALLGAPENALSVFRAALPASLIEAIDQGSLRLEPGSFVDEALAEVHSDLLFSARLRGRAAFVYILFEHQSTVDPMMPVRLLRYVMRIWDAWLARHPDARTIPAVLPVVLHQGPRPWTAARSLAELIDLPDELRVAVGRFVPALEMALHDLGEVTPVSLADFPGPPIVKIALSFMRAMADAKANPLDHLERLQSALREVLGQPGGAGRLRMVLRYTVLSRKGVDPRDVVDAFRRVGGPEAGEVVMSTVQELIDQGTRNVVALQLRERFGELPSSVTDRLEAASAAQLESWAKRVLSAKSLEDVFSSGKRRRASGSRKKK